MSADSWYWYPSPQRHINAFHPPSTLHKALAGNEGKLRILRTRKVINATPWGTLFPVDPSLVSSAHFDITLLMVLLRNLRGLTSPAIGWDKLPAETNVSREADIARVKYYRNTLYGDAERASVDDAAFNAYWGDIRDTLMRLGGVKYKQLLTSWKLKSWTLTLKIISKNFSDNGRKMKTT